MIHRLGAVILLFAPVPAFAESLGVPLKDTVPHMTTTGKASADVMPDEAELAFDVVQERKTGVEAADVTAKAATVVIATLKASGVEAGDIRTSFSMSETFDLMKDERGNISRTSRGYEAAEKITVRVRDLAKVGVIARDLIAKGVNAFERVSFSNSKASQKRRDLDAEAMRDALLQAKTYTDAVGLKLGRILQIGGDREEFGESQLLSASVPITQAKGVVIPIEPELLHLTQSVMVVWEIEGRAR